MNILILEDEPLAAERLQDFIRRYNPQATVAGWEQRLQDAAHWLASHPTPSLILSDIELLDGNVFQLFERLELSCPVIFATAYDQFLLRAFQANGIAYLLKPYDYEQFVEAMQKYERLLQPKILNNTAIQELKQALRPAFQQHRQRFTVKKARGIFLLQTADISYFQVEGRLLFAFTADGKRHTLSQTLSEVEEQLDPVAFFRLNRSEMVNLAHVLKLEPFGRDRLAVHMRGAEKPLVSSAGRTPGLRKWLEGES